MCRDTSPLAIALFSLLLGAGGSDPRPPASDPSGGLGAATANTASANDKSANSETNAPMGIDERIVKMCNLPEAHFDFDSASVSPSARNMLDKLATCFVSGPANGKGMRIVGHADERGETAYNFGLGQRRAGAIAGYLTKAGLDEDRITSSSRGELEATGHDRTGWARDRKVEILLAE